MDNVQKKEIIRCIDAYICNRLPSSYVVNLIDRTDRGWCGLYKLVLIVGTRGIADIDWCWPSIDAFFNGHVNHNGSTGLSFFEHIRSICSYKWIDKPVINALRPLLAVENMKTYEEMKMFFDINS